MKKARASSYGIKAVSMDRRSSAPNVLRSYEKVLESSFTPRERELLRKEKIKIVIGDLDTDDFTASGEYVGKRFGRHVIKIDDSKPLDAETMVHETIHILQEIDPERPSLEKSLRGSSEAINLKEALTEGETISRMRSVDGRNQAYYSDIRRNKSTDRHPISLKRSDHQLFRRDKMVGESPAENVHENFFRSKIQYMTDPKTGKTARSTMLKIRKKRK